MFISYLTAQFKRILKFFPAVMAIAAMLVCCLGFLALALLQADAGRERKQTVEIGLAGNTEGSYLGFGIQALQSLDSSRFAINFPAMESEEAARRALERGELTAYVLIPDGFVEAVVRGNNMPVTYVTSAGATGIGSMVMNELVDTISDLITESQSAVYGTQNLLREKGRQDIVREASDHLYLRYLDLILGRELIYEMELTGVSGGLSVLEYYICGIMILFLLLWGIAAVPFFSHGDTAISKLLWAKGLSAGGQVLAEYLAYAVLLLGNFLAAVFLGTVAIFVAGTLLPLEGTAASGGIAVAAREIFTFSRFGLFVGVLPVILLIAAMQLCIREWVSNPVTGALIQFLGALGLGYLSGCFYPLSFLPEKVQLFAPFLPTGAAMEYSGKLLLGQSAWGESAVMGIYGTVCFLATVLLRTHRIAR